MKSLKLALILIYSTIITCTETIDKINRQKELGIKLIDYLEKHLEKSNNIQDNTEMIKLLIQAGADINSKDDNGNTPLILACKNNLYKIVQLLINSADKSYLDIQNKKNETALIVASKNNNLKICKLLINNKADLNIKDDSSNTAFSVSADNNYLDLMDLLIKSGCNMRLCPLNKSINYALIKREQIKIVKSVLFKEIENGNYQKIINLIKNLVAVEMPTTLGFYDENGNNPLHYAIKIDTKKCDKNKIIDLILSIRPQLALEGNNQGKTPINLIFEKPNALGWIYLKKDIAHDDQNENKKEIKKLNKKDENGLKIINLIYEKNTPIHEKLEKIMLLIEIGANLNINDKYNDNPLNMASKKNHAQIVSILIKNGAKDEYALIESCKNNNIDIAKMLIDNNIDLNTKDKDGNTALNIAYNNSNYKIAKLLIKAGINLNIDFKDNIVWKVISSLKIDSNKIKDLIDKAVKKRETIKLVKQTIFDYIKENDFDKFKNLIKKLINAQMPATLNIYDQDGNNPLHYAFNLRDSENRSDKHKIIDFILSIRPQLFWQKNNCGKTPIELISLNCELTPWIKEKLEFLNNNKIKSFDFAQDDRP